MTHTTCVNIKLIFNIMLQLIYLRNLDSIIGQEWRTLPWYILPSDHEHSIYLWSVWNCEDRRMSL